MHFNKQRKKEAGFTLIELLIVIVIIGILAAIAIPRFNQTSQTAKENARAANVAMLQSAVERYYFDASKYPSFTEDDSDDSDELSFVPNYIKEMPVDPLGGTYTIDGDGIVSVSK